MQGPCTNMVRACVVFSVGGLFLFSGIVYADNENSKAVIQSIARPSENSPRDLHERAAALDLALFLNEAEGGGNVAVQQELVEKMVEVDSLIEVQNSIKENHVFLDDSRLDDLLIPGWDKDLGIHEPVQMADLTQSLQRSTTRKVSQGLERAVKKSGPRGLGLKKAALQHHRNPGLALAKDMAGKVSRGALNQMMRGARGGAIQEAVHRNVRVQIKQGFRGGGRGVGRGGGGVGPRGGGGGGPRGGGGGGPRGGGGGGPRGGGPRGGG